MKLTWMTTMALLGMAVHAACSDDDRERRNESAVGAAEAGSAAADSGKPPGSTVDAGPARGSESARDGAAPVGPADAAARVSKPGEYSGYSPALYSGGFALSSQYVAVRDGTKLAIDLYRPKQANGEVVTTPLPVIWMHTPYNRRYFQAAPGQERGLSGERYPGAAARLVQYGYVVAIVDFRGLYGSYGRNVAYNRGEWVDAARLDAYDITEWLAVQPWSSGKIGMWGCSATGGSQLQAATTAPPHLKAIFPMSCEFDAYPFGVPGGMAPPKGTATRVPPTDTPAGMRDMLAEPVDGDTDRAQLKAAVAEHTALGSIENAGYVPFRDSLAENIPDQRWWIKSSPHTYLEQLNASGIAVYLAANWDEAATKYGAFFTLNNLETRAKLIVGPAMHCAWFTVQMRHGFDLTIEELRFFDHWLKGVDNGVMSEPKIYYYTYNAPVGAEWRSASEWPLPNQQLTPYYLGAAALGTSAPTAPDAKDESTVDYTVTTMTLVDKGISYMTPPLDSDLEVTGHPLAELWVSSTATDGDFVATLQDVAPDGSATSYNMHGRLRASHRKEAPAPYNNLGLPWHPSREADVLPLVPGEPTKLRFDLLPISIVFKAGHRIRLVLTFADGVATPKLDPPPKVTIYRDSAHPSTLTLPIIKR
jgi:putative CocE/NonD family hydrolase